MRWRRVVPWVGLVLVASAALTVAATGGGGSDRSVAGRVEHVTAQLRCPTCQNLSVADSPSSTARAIRDDVRRRIEEGESDDEIKQAYAERYGDWVLLRPRSSGISAAVWALPVAAVVVAGGALGLAFRRWRSEPMRHATDDDRELVEQARAGRDEEAGA